MSRRRPHLDECAALLHACAECHARPDEWCRSWFAGRWCPARALHPSRMLAGLLDPHGHDR